MFLAYMLHVMQPVSEGAVHGNAAVPTSPEGVERPTIFRSVACRTDTEKGNDYEDNHPDGQRRQGYMDDDVLPYPS